MPSSSAIHVAEWFWMMVGVYAALGLVFAVVFVLRGVGRVDHAASGSSWVFRLLIIPGVAALWPIMLGKWLRANNHSSSGGHA